MSSIATLSVTVAALTSAGSALWAAKAERKLRSLIAAPSAVDRSELELEERAARREMGSALLSIRGAARISLASGTACALVALSDALTHGLAQGLPAATACFVLGSVGAGVAAHFGRLAKVQRSRFRGEWNTRGRGTRVT